MWRYMNIPSMWYGTCYVALYDYLVCSMKPVLRHCMNMPCVWYETCYAIIYEYTFVWYVTCTVVLCEYT